MPLYEDAPAWRRRGSGPSPVRPLTRVLLADPANFDVLEAQNVHMQSPTGALHRVDRGRARRQWETLAEAYRSRGIEVSILEPHAGHADFCFVANPGLVLPLPDGTTELWLSRMRHPSRRGEERALERFGRARGMAIREMPPSIPCFEGTGDGLLHPGRFLLHAGVGPRTDRAAWEALAAAHPDLHVFLLELRDERFYHLDTALCALDAARALVVREAFDDRGYGLLREVFPTVFEVPLEEALRFAANAHCPDGRHVFLERGCTETERWLERQGFEPVPIETGEFLKSGGSVFCLKQSY